MTQQFSAIEADKEFFDALPEANHASLNRLLVEDFVIVDVMSGGENNKSALLDAPPLGPAQVSCDQAG
jgi:hypothetical protein